MQNLFFKLIFFYFSVLSTYSFGNCREIDDKHKIIFKNKVQIYASKEELKYNENAVYSEIKIVNSSNNKVLFESIQEPTQLYLIKQLGDSIFLTQLQLIPDSTMIELTLTTLTERILSINSRNEVQISDENFIFKVDSLTTKQKQYLDSLCELLNISIKLPKKVYPLNTETTIYALFLGALSNYNCSYTMFINLAKYFELDGAFAETRKEIPFEYIWSKLKK